MSKVDRIHEGGSPYRLSIEIVNRRCKILKLFRDIGIHKFMVIDIRHLPRGVTRHLVRIPLNYLNEIPRHTGVKMRNTIKAGDEAIVWFETDGCDVCNTLASKGAFLVTAWNTGEDKIVYAFIAPNAEAVQDIVSTLESLDLKLRVLGMERYRSRPSILTGKQEVVLWLALEAGFFDCPKKISIMELSRRLKIAPSSLSENIRRGVRRLLEYYFENFRE